MRVRSAEIRAASVADRARCGPVVVSHVCQVRLYFCVTLSLSARTKPPAGAVYRRETIRLYPRLWGGPTEYTDQRPRRPGADRGAEGEFRRSGPVVVPGSAPATTTGRYAPYRTLAHEAGPPPDVAVEYRAVAVFRNLPLAGRMDQRRTGMRLWACGFGNFFDSLSGAKIPGGSLIRRDIALLLQLPSRPTHPGGLGALSLSSSHPIP